MARWDLFCRVVDNFGDVGVCWRLARTLIREHDASVRLWIDDRKSLHALAPAVDPGRSLQTVESIEIRHWPESSAFPDVVPADVVVEAFGCGLPEPFIEAMAARSPQPVWIVLEYLSAEPWVAEFHGRPSPHPRYPMTRMFVFPGFDDSTGGLLRERDLLARRDAFGTPDRDRFWHELGFEPPSGEASTILMFAYASAPILQLLHEIERSAQSTVVAVPQGPLDSMIRESFGLAQSAIGHQRGRLELRFIPFVEQSRFDGLLWAADLNFVRGEDSFVRAQWGAKPLVWQIYPQAENAHSVKLEAFLDRYLAGATPDLDRVVREFWHAWNGLHWGNRVPTIAAAWPAFVAAQSALSAHAKSWSAHLAEMDTLANRLAKIARERLKF